MMPEHRPVLLPGKDLDPSRKTRIRGFGSRLLFTAILLISSLAPAVGADRAPLLLGVHPYLAPQELEQRFTPLARYLATLLDRRVEIAVGTDYAEHIREVGEGRLDIAYLGPASYVELVRRYGPVPLLARLEVNGSPVLYGEILVRENSGLRDLEDLSGKIFAFGDPKSTMGTQVPKRMLDLAGVKLGHQLHLTGHENVVLAVLSGMADAGAVKEEVYRAYASRGLRSIARSPPISEHLFVAGRNLPPSVTERIRAGMLSLATQTDGLTVIRAIRPMATGLVSVRDADYDSLR